MNDSKHRTQISLDQWQYQVLLEASRKTRKSLSAMIRELITERFSVKADASRDSLNDIVGLGASGHRTTARKHDEVLYKRAR